MPTKDSELVKGCPPHAQIVVTGTTSTTSLGLVWPIENMGHQAVGHIEAIYSSDSNHRVARVEMDVYGYGGPRNVPCVNVFRAEPFGNEHMTEDGFNSSIKNIALFMHEQMKSSFGVRLVVLDTTEDVLRHLGFEAQP